MSSSIDPRQDVLDFLMSRAPYLMHIGFEFTPNATGDALEAKMPYSENLIGNPALPALHGGVIASFLEMTAMVNLGWATDWNAGLATPDVEGDCTLPPLPKTIDLTIDYMRSGKPVDSFARAKISRAGRRFATVHVDVWQDDPERLIAQAMCHFLMPRRDG